MREKLKYKRAVFPSKIQRRFIEKIERRITFQEMARICKCSERTLRDWRREKFRITLSAVYALSTRTGVSVPKSIKVRDAYEHTSAAGKKGGAAILSKYGRVPVNESRRKERWQAWWRKTGKFGTSSFPNEPLAIKTPPVDVTLAEFIGIMMGDGGLSKYQATVTLHHINDAEYAVYVAKMIKKLFGVTPAMRYVVRNSVVILVVSRRKLVQHLHSLGLPIGNKIKQGLDMPEWIKKNAALATACIRGLVDTDGSIFTHRYKVNGKWYRYKKLSFTSASPALVDSVSSLLKKFGCNPHISRNGRDVRLDRVADTKWYFSVIGTHNPKHWKRYRKSVG